MEEKCFYYLYKQNLFIGFMYKLQKQSIIWSEKMVSNWEFTFFFCRKCFSSLLLLYPILLTINHSKQLTFVVVVTLLSWFSILSWIISSYFSLSLRLMQRRPSLFIFNTKFMTSSKAPSIAHVLSMVAWKF